MSVVASNPPRHPSGLSGEDRCYAVHLVLTGQFIDENSGSPVAFMNRLWPLDSRYNLHARQVYVTKRPFAYMDPDEGFA